MLIAGHSSKKAVHHFVSQMGADLHVTNSEMVHADSVSMHHPLGSYTIGISTQIGFVMKQWKRKGGCIE